MSKLRFLLVLQNLEIEGLNFFEQFVKERDNLEKIYLIPKKTLIVDN